MGLIMVAKVYTGADVVYRAYLTDEERFVDLTFRQVYALDKEFCVNFRVSKTKKVISKTGKLRQSIIRDNEVIEEYDTVIGVNDACTELKVLKLDGSKDYIKIDDILNDKSWNRLNNLHVEWVKGTQSLRFKRYAKEGQVLELAYMDLGNDADDKGENTVNSEESKVYTENHSDGTGNYSDSSIEDKTKTDNETDYFNIFEEIEKIENNECQEDEKEDTQELIEDTQRINDYREIIWNMYPNDRITIQAELFKGYSSRILKILDSSVDGMTIVSLREIYKQDRTKCTYALVQDNIGNSTVTVQVLGQSDIPEKALETDLNGICLKYASWLRQTKYIKL